MKNRSISEVRKSKAFYIQDIIVYLTILVLTAVLLCVFLLPNDSYTLESIDVFYKDYKIFYYDFSSKNWQINSDFADNITINTESEVIFVKISIENGNNILKIGDGFVKMEDADCSVLPICVNNFSPIEKGGDVIVCMPHHIKVVGNGDISNEVKL